MSSVITTVPIRRGMPASANSKKPKRPTPASSAASETSTFTGLPVRANRAPAWAPNASGIRSCEVGSRTRIAITTTTGTSAATAPFTLMSAVASAQITMTDPTTRDRPVPARATSCWPTHVVTPVASRASLTTNSAAM